MAARPVEDLRFEADLVIRYHDRQRSFFDNFDKWVAALSILGASAAAAGLAGILQGTGAWGNAVVVIAALMVGVLNTFDLVWGVTALGRQHDTLYRRFVEWDAKMAAVAHPTQEQLHQWESEGILLEREQPPYYWSVYARCWNQAIEARGRDKRYLRHISGWRALPVLGHFVRFRETNFPLAA